MSDGNQPNLLYYWDNLDILRRTKGFGGSPCDNVCPFSSVCLL